MSEPKDRVEIGRRYDSMALNQLLSADECLRRDIADLLHKLIPFAKKEGMDATNCDLQIIISYIRRKP